jgi:hypothetical protein
MYVCAPRQSFSFIYRLRRTKTSTAAACGRLFRDRPICEKQTPATRRRITFLARAFTAVEQPLQPPDESEVLCGAWKVHLKERCFLSRAEENGSRKLKPTIYV